MLLLAGYMLLSAVVLLLIFLFTHLFLSKGEIESFEKRFVFITGCDTGFGNLLARSLDAKGVNVIAACLTNRGAQDLKAVTSPSLRTVIVDVTDKTSIQAAYDFTVKTIGQHGLWGVVNNAGIMPTFAPVEWTAVEEFEGACKVNLFGTIAVTLSFMPLLRQSRGRLVNVSSVTSSFAYPGIANYVISKAGVKMFSVCLRRELHNTGVTVHVIEPGGFRTNLTEKNRIMDILKKNYTRASPESRDVYGGRICTYLTDGIKVANKHVTGDPQVVADAMTHALLAKHPKLRYLVGKDAHLFFRMLGWLPEWVVDNVIGWPSPYGKTCSVFDDLDSLKGN